MIPIGVAALAQAVREAEEFDRVASQIAACMNITRTEAVEKLKEIHAKMSEEGR